jgi:hypothetical protein
LPALNATGEACSHNREHPALQNMKFLNFVPFLCVIFALPDPDPDQDADLIESGSNPDPDPKHCLLE